MLGMAYKKDIDDLRESPSLTIIELLREEGAEVLYNDPYFPTVGRGRHYNLNMTCTPLENLGQYDCVLIVTDHSDYDYRGDRREVEAGGGFAQCNEGDQVAEDRSLLNGPFVLRPSGERVNLSPFALMGSGGRRLRGGSGAQAGGQEQICSK